MIKILRDICISHPDFPKTTEICVKMLRRICDEEGIKVKTELRRFNIAAMTSGANTLLAIYRHSV